STPAPRADSRPGAPASAAAAWQRSESTRHSERARRATRTSGASGRWKLKSVLGREADQKCSRSQCNPPCWLAEAGQQARRRRPVDPVLGKTCVLLFHDLRQSWSSHMTGRRPESRRRNFPPQSPAPEVPWQASGAKIAPWSDITPIATRRAPPDTPARNDHARTLG